MAYIPQPKDITNFMGSSASPNLYSNQTMFRGPTLPSQQSFTGNSTPQAEGMPQTPQMPQTQPQQPMQSPWGGAQQPNIQQILQSIMGQNSHVGMSKPMFSGMLR